MKDEIRHWLNEYAPDWKNQQYLIAVSGGRDSMALCTVLLELEVKFCIAHCNFQLRGEASEQDAAFVLDFANRNKVACFIKKFNTKNIIEQTGDNLQETARTLRYNWFNSLLDEHQLTAVMVGTHLNDSAETLLMNLMRGSGLTGLHGILPVRSRVVRPFINTSRSEIDRYVKQRKVEFREDASNRSNNYERNQMRNVLIPQIKALYPHFDAALKTSIEHLQHAESLVQREVKRINQHLIRQEGDQWFINIALLRDLKPLSYYLYESLKPFNFNSTVVRAISKCNFDQPGKQFLSPTHVLTVDRNYLILEKNAPNGATAFKVRKISLADRSIQQPITLNIEFIDAPVEINPSNDCAYLDAERLTFPLTLRTWKAGDKFQPFGMQGFKKVSDFLIDQKMALPKKKEQLVLLSGKEIVWLVGQRIDNRYGVKKSTKKVYFVEQK